MPDSIAAPLDPALPPPAWAPRLPSWAWAVLYVAALWLLRCAALAFTDGPGGIAVVWPTTGLLVYALLVTGRRLWPALVGLTLAVGLAGSLAAGRAPGQALAFNGAVAAEALATAWLAVRLGGRPTLRTLRGALVLVVASAAAVAVASAVSLALLSAGQASFGGVRLVVFWGGSTLGVVLLSSFLVEWTEPAPVGGRGGEAAVSVAAIAAGFAVALALLRHPGMPATGDVVLLPPLLWAALRFGQRGATLALLVGAAAYLAWAPWTGALVGSAVSTPPGPLGIQLFLGVGAVSILAVAAVGEERRTAEARRILLEGAMDHSPDPAGILTGDGRVLWANEAAARAAGLPRAAVVGRPIWTLGGSREAWLRLWERARSGPVLRSAPPLPAIPAGEISAALVNVGTEQLLVAVLHDLTDRRRAEEASRLAAIGTLAAGVAHEINNPLSCVVSNLAHLERRLAALPDADGSLREDVLDPLAEAEEGARRVRDIVRQLGAFARADEATGPVDPARALSAALAMAGNDLRHRARVVTEVVPTPAVLASEARLTEVFLSLLQNAAQGIPEGSASQHEIRITLGCRGEEVVAEVADTGPELSAATRSRIFEPFFAARSSGSGAGLGLAISHAVVSRLGGRIDVESTAGQGSRFRVVLPAASAAAAAARAPAPGAGPAGTPAPASIAVEDD